VPVEAEGATVEVVREASEVRWELGASSGPFCRGEDALRMWHTGGHHQLIAKGRQ
jgi:hypothetical protein